MARILLLGADRVRAADVRGLLGRDRHQVTWIRSTENWCDREREIVPELVIAAVGSTDSVVKRARARQRGFLAPLLFVQQESDFLREPYLEGRLVDRVSSPFMSDEFLGRVDALLRVRQVIRGEVDAGAGRGKGGGGLKSRLSAWLRSRLPDQERPCEPYLEVAARVAEWADRRDAFEPGHAERVTSFCAMIAESLRMDEQETGELLSAAMLHDIGKVALPMEILHQRQPLDEAQQRLIRTHPSRGAKLLMALERDERVARVVLYHHERPDGTGYYGKEPGGVPRASQALAVAETYDAMTSSRVRDVLEPPVALERLRDGRGSAYDAECVDALADQLKPRRGCIPVSRLS